MRRLHRWVSTFSMVFLGWVGVTGVLLAIDSMSPPGPLEERPEQVEAPESMRAHAALRMFQTTLSDAMANAPSEVVSVDMRLQRRDGRTVVRIAVASDGSARYYDVETGSLVAEFRPSPTMIWLNDVPSRLRIHNLLQDLHRGSIIGIPGQIIDVLTGFCFIFMGVSGTTMYVQLLMRRRRIGRKSLFWR